MAQLNPNPSFGYPNCLICGKDIATPFDASPIHRNCASVTNSDGEAVEEIVFTEQEIELNQILKYFKYQHLPAHLQETSKSFARLAKFIVDNIPSNRANIAERTVALRKLLEAKDAAVRAKLDE
jgi:hypothetical protein